MSDHLARLPRGGARYPDRVGRIDVGRQSDLRGFFGLCDQVRRGYKEIRVNFTVKSDASPEQLRELTAFSPVYDIVSNPVPVTINIKTRWCSAWAS
jgi:hypothetical protein